MVCGRHSRVPMDPASSRSAAAALIAPVGVVVVPVIVVVVVVGMLHAAEVVLVLISPDVASQVGAGLLIEPKMDASVDARVADVVSDLVEPRVVEGQPRHGGVRHGDGMPAGTEGANQHLGGAIAPAPVIRRIAGKTRRGNERLIVDVAGGFRVAIQGALENRRLG